MSEEKNNKECSEEKDEKVLNGEGCECEAKGGEAPENSDEGGETGETAPESEEIDECVRLTEELGKVKNSYIRLMADFDNYKKKTLKEKSDLLKYGGEGIIKSLLPVIDDFERALANMPEEESAVKEGVVLIYGKFMNFLSQNGVKEIETAGKPFDTDFHEAVTMIPATENAAKGTVVDCIQKGYAYHDKVIRYAKVVVAQ